MGSKPVVTITHNRLPELAKRLPNEVRAEIAATGMTIIATIQAGMKAPKHGETYKRGKKYHVASAPGEMPAIDYGDLMGSLGFRWVERFAALVHTGDTEYAPYLEYGTGKMKARPFMKPAAEAEREKFVSRIIALLKRL